MSNTTVQSFSCLACGALIVKVCHYEIIGLVVAISAVFLIYFAGFWTLFSLDLHEALVTTVFCALLQDAAALVVFLDGK
jgi:hypothetical protein